LSLAAIEHSFEPVKKLVIVQGPKS